MRTYNQMVYGAASDEDMLAGKWYTIGSNPDFRQCECPSFYPLPAATPGFENEYEQAAATGDLPTHVHKTVSMCCRATSGVCGKAQWAGQYRFNRTWNTMFMLNSMPNAQCQMPNVKCQILSVLAKCAMPCQINTFGFNARVCRCVSLSLLPGEQSCGGDWWQVGTYTEGLPKQLGQFNATAGWEDLFEQKRIDQGQVCCGYSVRMHASSCHRNPFCCCFQFAQSLTQSVKKESSWFELIVYHVG